MSEGNDSLSDGQEQLDGWHEDNYVCSGLIVPIAPEIIVFQSRF